MIFAISPTIRQLPASRLEAPGVIMRAGRAIRPARSASRGVFSGRWVPAPAWSTSRSGRTTTAATLSGPPTRPPIPPAPPMSPGAASASRYIPLYLPQTDADADGYGAACDCDDNNPAINPGAAELCNGIDDNCNTLVDAADPGFLSTPDLYVDNNVTVSGVGTSWATAFKTLAEALRVAHMRPCVARIHVAKGTYYPAYKPFDAGGVEITTSDDRDKTFHLRNGLEILGGYPTGGARAM
ncbi:MAG: putative metal-binding motif-containing protein [Haliscomenobacter sp.]|nr:putative metal-binding motif-containing protein [Haliscomenobacter sp.]